MNPKPPHDRSGLELAEQAHRAGAVTAPVELPLVDVALTFTVHGSTELAEAIVDNIVGRCILDEPAVPHGATAALTERV